jgi:hypothetical protein
MAKKSKDIVNKFWFDLVELVESEDHCDEMNVHQERDIINFIADATITSQCAGDGFLLLPSEPKHKLFLSEMSWAASEYYNAEYACEAPGSRRSHFSGYNEAMAKAKKILSSILAG